MSARAGKEPTVILPALRVPESLADALDHGARAANVSTTEYRRRCYLAAMVQTFTVELPEARAVPVAKARAVQSRVTVEPGRPVKGDGERVPLRVVKPKCECPRVKGQRPKVTGYGHCTGCGKVRS